MDDHGATLKYEDVELQLRISTRTIRREMRAGKLRYMRFGRQIRFTQEQVDEYKRIATMGPTVLPSRTRRRRAA